MLKILYSENIWKQIIEVRGRKPITAVISYVNKDHLKLRAKDTLICDASESRIASGATTHELLNLLAKRKVNLWHLDKLHAKVIRLSEHVLVSSANMTSNSESLFEAAILTDQAEAVCQVDTMLNKLLNSGRLKRIDQKFLDRIKKIPVSYSGENSKREGERIGNRDPVSWVMAYCDLSEREQKKSNQVVATKMGLDEAPSYFRTSLKPSNNAPPIQRGDSLIFVNKTSMRVQRPAAVTGIIPTENYLFYIYEDIISGEISWKRARATLSKAGFYRRSKIPQQLALDSKTADIIKKMFRRPKP